MKKIAALFLGLTSCSLIAPDSSYFSGAFYNTNAVHNSDATVELPEVIDTSIHEVLDTREVQLEVLEVLDTTIDTSSEADASDEVSDTSEVFEAEAEVYDPLVNVPKTGPYRFNILEETNRFMGSDPCVISWDNSVGNDKKGSLRYTFPMPEDGTTLRCELDLYIGPPYVDFPTYGMRFYVRTNSPGGAVIKPFIKRGRGYSWADNGSTTVYSSWTSLFSDLDTPPFHSDQISAVGIEISISPYVPAPVDSGISDSSDSVVDTKPEPEVLTGDSGVTFGDSGFPVYTVWVDDFVFAPK